MRVVWLSHIVPFPPHGGAAQRAYYLMRALASQAEIHLVAFSSAGAANKTTEEARKELQKYCARVHFWKPAFPRSGPRWFWELASAPIRKQPLSCRPFTGNAILRDWEALLRALPDALIHCDTPDLGVFAATTNHRALVLTHHNCESHLAARRADAERNPLRRFYLRQEAERLARLERALCHGAKVNVVVSEADRRRLLRVNPAAHVHVVENGAADTSPAAAKELEADPPQVLFTGLMDWEPNVAAVEFFVTQIWPQIRQAVPNAQFVVAGRNPASRVRRLAESTPGMTLVPNPAEMREWFERAAVFACPLRTGGGTRIKILEAMAAGTPVVSTAVGCEGLNLRSGEHILVQDVPADFAAAVIWLLRNPEIRRRIGAAGRELVGRLYLWQQIGRKLKDAWSCAAGVAPCATAPRQVATTFDSTQSPQA